MKELLIRTLNHETTERAPWVPFAGVHAGKLKGYTATKMLTDADAAFESLMEVNRLYRPDGQPVIFDLQIEAECLGCELRWADDCPPSVASHPLETEDEDEAPETPCNCKIPTKESGRIPYVLDVMRRMKEAVGDTTALYGLICGPFTLASHLRGNQLFTDMFDFEDEVKSLLAFCARTCMKMAEYYIGAGMDVIAMVDPLISQISSDDFNTYCADPYREIFAMIRDKGVYSSFFVCGDATRNIENMCQTGPDSISIDENVDILKAKEITDKYNIVIGGNIPLTSVMLLGNQQDNMKFAVDLLDSIPEKKNFILAPGCDMPYDVPVENTIGISQAVHDLDSTREMVKNYKSEEVDTSGVVLPDYENLKKPLVEVFTLDSAQCAACGYMMNAANQAKETFGDQIDVVEYKFIYKENVARCVKMGVPNLPSMYINGELKYRSLIPSREELEKAIQAAIDQMA
ncbi:MAG: uroporphyrinogen decarboxylase family protein [Lachnospiraceae bacterium]|jgi:uroporphyrinogen decarboxylase|nr:uroporphyrinogen decarboxylase family protein [Lachnospiraceae bacterium]MCI1657171.1 uroporphyrinogen decarboxylase family protein [Lachnospiraceae bacterium]MCI2195612.1 uroporphyrinogen decarboxylase family protein [Lachnospiraceae bacterium]HAD20017.1 uroporphyrinogen decarboxylase [Lachnospiraceae bacterium]